MEIKVNEKEIAENVLNAISESITAKLIKETLLRYHPKAEEIERSLSCAAQEVAKEVFLDYLRNNEQFTSDVRSAVAKELNDKLIDKLIKTLTGKIY